MLLSAVPDKYGEVISVVLKKYIKFLKTVERTNEVLEERLKIREKEEKSKMIKSSERHL